MRPWRLLICLVLGHKRFLPEYGGSPVQFELDGKVLRMDACKRCGMMFTYQKGDKDRVDNEEVLKDVDKWKNT